MEQNHTSTAEAKQSSRTAQSTNEPHKPRKLGRPKRLLSAQAQKAAAAVLEVLAGSLSVKEAAAGLGISEAGYYHVEDRALRGLASACEPAVKGPHADPGTELNRLKKRQVRLEQELKRYQALTRATQRAAGIMIPRPVETKPDKNGRMRKKRRPLARALRAAERFKAGAVLLTPESPGVSAGA